mgnify:CR=1 FL=1
MTGERKEFDEVGKSVCHAVGSLADGWRPAAEVTDKKQSLKQNELLNQGSLNC